MARKRKGRRAQRRPGSLSPLPAIGMLLAAGAAAGVLYNVLSPRGIFHPAPVTSVKRTPVGVGAVKNGGVERKQSPPVVKVEIVDMNAVREIVSKGTAVVVDARSVQSYEFGHIPGAVNVPAPSFNAAFEAKKHLLPAGLRILVYCASANCDESEKVLDALKARGYSRLLHYKNGWNEWELAGLPFERAPAGQSSP